MSQNNKTYCNIIEKGMFVSHQGISLCCVNSDKHKNIKPSEFWYGQTRKNAQKNMADNTNVKGCDLCYYNEKNKIASSRTFYNSYKDVPAKKLPTMLDLDFSNFCNLKCIMCNPYRSSEWAKDRGLDVSKIHMDLIDDLASISDNVTKITIQGGEPTIMKEYEYYFDLLHNKNLAKNIDIQIITNITNLNHKFYRLLQKFKSVRLSVSIDAYDLANNYIRWPSKFEQIEKNLIKVSDLKSLVKVEILNTLNILSMFNYYDFLLWCKKIETIFMKKNRYFGVVPMKVIEPPHFSPFIAPNNLKEKFIDDVKTFFADYNLNGNSKFKTEIMLLIARLKRSRPNDAALNKLKNTVMKTDSQRQSKIENFIPNFYNFV